jgi:hypothetical protein
MNHKTKRPIDEGDWNMAFLFPDEVAAARARNGLVILPLAPVEWHGPHLAMGCDNLLAHAFARRLARELECPYYPPLWVSTERQRSPEVLEALGFDRTARVEGMDFPNHSVASGYFREEVFALVVRDILHILFERMRFDHVLIVNGHGAENQKAVLNRICDEFNAGAAEEQRVIWGLPWISAFAVGRVHWPRGVGRNFDAGIVLAGMYGHCTSPRQRQASQCGLRNRGRGNLRLCANSRFHVARSAGPPLPHRRFMGRRADGTRGDGGD